MNENTAVNVRTPLYRSSVLRKHIVSVITPIYGEEDNVEPLFAALLPVLRGLGRDFEIIAVNDGSHDGSLQRLRAASATIPELRVIDFRRNYGQTAAIMAGIDYAVGEIIIPIDADLQNDPEDIPALLAKLDEGYDVVSGWRQNRKDQAFRRNFVSRIANIFISWISGVKLKDYGCTLKGLSERRTERRSLIWRDASLYSYLCQLDGCAHN